MSSSAWVLCKRYEYGTNPEPILVYTDDQKAAADRHLLKNICTCDLLEWLELPLNKFPEEVRQ